MKDLLESKGWVMYYECVLACGHKQYFHHKDKYGYEVRSKPKKSTCSILLNNVIIDGPFWGYELEQKLLKNGI